MHKKINNISYIIQNMKGQLWEWDCFLKNKSEKYPLEIKLIFY